MKTITSRSIATQTLAESLGVSETTIRNRIKRGRYTSAGRGKVALNSQVRAEIATRSAAATDELDAAIRAAWPSVLADVVAQGDIDERYAGEDL